MLSKCAEFTEDLTRDFRGSDEDWIQRRQKELQQDRQSWRESLNFQPESLNGSGAARQASLGEKIKEGFDKVWTACSGSMLQLLQGMRSIAYSPGLICMSMSHAICISCSPMCHAGIDCRLLFRVPVAGGAGDSDWRADSLQIHGEEQGCLAVHTAGGVRCACA